MANLSKVKAILESNTVITTDVYLSIIDALPAGLYTKLRLVPDSHLSAKLAHLLAVARIENTEESMGFDYEPISFEGINDNKYFIDHDAIIKSRETGKVYIIDCTSDPALVSNKASILGRRIIAHPHIDSSKVHLYTAKRFDVNVNKPAALLGESKVIFDLFDTISKRSLEWRNEFFTACADVYRKASATFLSKERRELVERYNVWNIEPKYINIAKQLITEHTDNDAELFAELTSKVPAKTYFECFEKILAQQAPITAPFFHRPSVISASNKLEDVLKDLQDNVIARGLLLAINNTAAWVGIRSDDTEAINAVFYEGGSRRTTLPISAPYKILVKHRTGHSFLIRFRDDIIDENFLEQICKYDKTDKGKEKYSIDPIDAYEGITADYETMTGEMNTATTTSVSNTVLGKITTLSKEYTDVSNHAIQKGTTITMIAANYLNTTCLGELINHDYEVAKSFAASLKVSPRSEEYYVGVNGPFSSVTITRMSSTQDSFTTSSYFTIYRTNVRNSLKSVRAIFTNTEGIIQSKTRSFNKNTIAHALKLPFVIVSLLTWEIENNSSQHSVINKNILMKLSANSALHASVNSDQFAQAAEQLRYLFTSNTGLGASAEAICEKIHFIRPKTTWELLYIFRMLKLGASLNVMFKTKNIGSVIVNNQFAVLFPNSVQIIRSFSYLISSMYYANIYNKFRAFHEVSEAICYNELIAENKIYDDCRSRQNAFVHGISEESFYLLLDEGPFRTEDFISQEISFCKELIDSGPGRFMMSLSFIIGATITHVAMTPEVIADIYKVLGSSPIDACTMHGAMSSGKATIEHQGIRAASAILEELISETRDDAQSINESINNGTLFANKIKEENFDFSILSAAARQFEFKEDYQYRIVQKDQKGHREISVLNAKFRIGALLCEKIAHEASTLVKCDVLDNSMKDMIVEDSVRDAMHKGDTHFAISDNSDQKRWGPNHLLHSFAAMYLGLLRDDIGLFRIVNMTLHYGECKIAKFPENLVDLAIKTKYLSRSEPISMFFRECRNNIENQIYGRNFEWGMCQGIYHRTSSLYHGIMCQVVSDIIIQAEDIPKADVRSFVTSDDAERIIHVKEKVSDRVSLCRRIHSVINNVGCVMNILRNESKSVFSAHITEFNSIFYHKGVLATPTLKQRIAKIDIGDGADPLLDYLTASSLGMAYFQNGGSFVGTIVITLLNLVLHTEQWNNWQSINKGKFELPVEFGGFPAIDPFSVLYSGPISTFYLKWKTRLTPEEYAYVVANTLLLPAVEVTLNDFKRDLSKPKDDVDITIFKNAGPLGVLSLNRTDRKLSQFERRHKMGQWRLPDNYATLSKYDSSGIGFVFNLFKLTKTAEFDHSLGINSFYIRFTDPWVNNDRKCYRIHENSYINKNVFKNDCSGLVSPSEVRQMMDSVTEQGIIDFVELVKLERRRTDPETDIPVRLQFLLQDALAINKRLDTIVDPIFIIPRNKNSIVKVNLSVRTSIDEDVFRYSLLKSVIGDNIKDAIINASGTPDIWDKIHVYKDLPTLDAASGIFYCDNIIQTYSKYIRRSIKLICPGNSRPQDIPDLLTKILSCKFTELYGIPAPKFDPLIYASVSGHAYMKRNFELQELSDKVWKIKEKNINFNNPVDQIKYYIESDSDTITAFDSFDIVDRPSKKKTVIISCANKLIFMQKMHLWSAIHVHVRLSEKAKQMLLNNEFTNKHEYCLDNNTFIKNQTGFKYVTRANGAKTFEIQTARIVGSDTVYDHVFYVDSNAYYLIAECAKIRDAPGEGWHMNIVNEINNKRRFRNGEKHYVLNRSGRVTDTITFVGVTNRDEYLIRTYANNLTIFIEHINSATLIPVCSQNLSDIDHVNVGFNYTADHFQEAMTFFSPIYEDIFDFNQLSPGVRNYLKFLLFRTSAITPPCVINQVAERNNVEIRFSSIESIDVFRSLILSSLATEITGSQARVKFYFLNLFRASPSYNNGITSVKFEEVADPIIDEEDDLDTVTGLEAEELDLNIPDIPLWLDNEPEYDDMFSQEKVTVPAPARVHDDASEFMDDYAFDLDTFMGEDADIYSDDEPYQSPVRGDDIQFDIGPIIDDRSDLRGSQIINRHFEECYGLIDHLKGAIVKLRPTGRVRFLNYNARSINDTLKAIITKTGEFPETTSRVVSQLYPAGHYLYEFGLPISAMCLIELYFKQGPDSDF